MIVNCPLMISMCKLTFDLISVTYKCDEDGQSSLNYYMK